MNLLDLQDQDQAVQDQAMIQEEEETHRKVQTQDQDLA